jgi:hypothetical protein
MLKSGFKSVETYVLLLAAVLKAVFPADFPLEAFLAMTSWGVARAGQKFFGLVDTTTGKPSWKTSEFWITIVYAVVTTGLSQQGITIPVESVAPVIGYSVGRAAIKANETRKVSPPSS